MDNNTRYNTTARLRIPSSKSVFDIYDQIFTYSNTKFDVTCCQLNGSSVTVSCGQGVSCSNQPHFIPKMLLNYRKALARSAARRSATRAMPQYVLQEGARTARLTHFSEMKQQTKQRKEHEMVSVSTHIPALTSTFAPTMFMTVN